MLSLEHEANLPSDNSNRELTNLLSSLIVLILIILLISTIGAINIL